ncbi:hypothetical protein GCM10010302_75330 [Streptomyces polychromogenes]|uniref:Secreted protein n=1 Tax=Streptomyces polychromogenes TaxID=67342 RepID=A0ABP3FT42_9ACTN
MAATAIPTPFLVTAAITVTVQLVMGTLQLNATRRLTRITLDEQRDQLDIKAAHDRAAALRDAQYTAYLMFLKAAHGLVAEAGIYSADPQRTPRAESWSREGLFRSWDHLTIVLPDGLREAAVNARDALEDVRLTGGPTVSALAQNVYDASMAVAEQGVRVAAAREAFADVHHLEDGPGTPTQAPEVSEAREVFVAKRRQFGDARREFSALARSEMWGVT